MIGRVDIILWRIFLKNEKNEVTVSKKAMFIHRFRRNGPKNEVFLVLRLQFSLFCIFFEKCAAGYFDSFGFYLL